MRPSYGVVVGRFQVHELHEGHMELFRAVRGRHNRVIVFVGVAPMGMTKRNPLDFMTRKAMIQAKFPEFTVLPLKDMRTDELWSESLDEKIREVVNYGDVTLYGGRDSFVPHYHGCYRPVELNLVSNDTHPSGTDIRNQLTNTVMESPDFRAGVIYAAMNQRPRAIPCVDVIIMYKTEEDVHLLLGRKKNDMGLWRFIGGHAEPTTATFEDDVRNEAMEESGLDLSAVRYIGSTVVDDWRWSSEENRIKTLIFVASSTSMAARAGDDIDEVKWFKMTDVTLGILVSEHWVLLDKFTQFAAEKFLKEEKGDSCARISQ